MYERERIILRLYFPQFNSPLSSRFQNYFSILNKTENLNNDSEKNNKNNFCYYFS